MTAVPINYHCSVVKIGQAGILIRGKSGSGKTSVALGLLERAEFSGLKHALVCDDQALLSIEHGRITAAVPPSIAGKIEIYGFGITERPYIHECRINLVAHINPESEFDRMPEPEYCELLGIEIPMVRLPFRHEQLSVRIVEAWLVSRAQNEV